MQKADLSLTAMEDDIHGGNGCYGQSIVSLLKQYKLIKSPPEKQWHKIGVFGDKKEGDAIVEMSIESNVSGESGDDEKKKLKKKQSTQSTKYTFRSFDGCAIDAFLDTVFQWYICHLKDEEDISRYYYDLEGQIRDPNAAATQRTYKRFRLSKD